MRKRLRWPCRLGVALAIAVVPWVVAPTTGSATSPAETLSIAPNAVLVPILAPPLPAFGPVIVTLNYSCVRQPASGVLNATVAEQSSVNPSVEIVDSGAATATCDDQRHSTTVETAGGFAFVRGPAAVSATLCSSVGCISATGEVTIK